VRIPRLTDEANRDLEGIWVYIATDNFDAADRVYDKIQADIQKLSIHPGMGHSRADSPSREYRFWSVYSYLIVYRYDDSELAVIRVIHGARDIGSILR
jgi:plasmid stabilization system protein ParE